MSEIKIIDFNQELSPYKHNIIETERLKILAMSTYSGFMTRIMEYINSDDSYSTQLTIPNDVPVKSLCYVITFKTCVKYPSSEEKRIVTDASDWEICTDKQLKLNENIIFNEEFSKASAHFLNDSKIGYDELKAAAYLFSFNDSLCDFYSVYPILNGGEFFNGNICIKAVVETDVAHTKPLAFYLFYANPYIDFSKFNPNFKNYLDEIIIKTTSQRDLGLFLMTKRAYSILNAAPKIPHQVNQIQSVNTFCNYFDKFASRIVGDLNPDTLTRIVFNVTFKADGKTFFDIADRYDFKDVDIHTIGRRVNFGLNISSNIRRMMYGAVGYPEKITCYMVYDSKMHHTEIYVTYINFSTEEIKEEPRITEEKQKYKGHDDKSPYNRPYPRKQ